MNVDKLGGRLVAIFAETKRITMIDDKTVTQLALKTSEETGELAEAALCFGDAPGTKYKDPHKHDLDHLVEEAADVILCAAATAIKALAEIGYSAEFLLTQIERKQEKWERVVKEVK